MIRPADDRLHMALNGFTRAIGPEDASTYIHYESLIAAEFDRCHPGDSFTDLKRRARFAKEDQGLLGEWMARAARLDAAQTRQRETRPPAKRAA